MRATMLAEKVPRFARDEVARNCTYSARVPSKMRLVTVSAPSTS